MIPSPKQEPVAYSTLIALLIGALVSYGLPITDELTQFLIVALPVIISAVVARSQVTPVSNPKP